MKHESFDNFADRIKPRMASSVLLWVIVGFFAVFVLWAALTELDRTAHGIGRVVPTAQLQVVSNLEGGVVRAILVRAGQSVRQGTPLIRLDGTARGAELGSGQSAYDALAAKVARLEAEISGRSPQFPASSDPTVLEQIAIERSLYLSRQSDLASLTSAAAARIAQSERAVAEAQAGYQAAVTARDSARVQADILRPLVANGVEPRLSLIQAERQAAVAASQATQAAAAVARARASVSEARASASQQRQEWRATAGAELASTQADMAARRQTLPALSDAVRRTVIRAPLSGRINRVMVTTVGGTVRPGEPVAEIVPAEQGLTIEAAVRPEDIAFVRMQQRALVKITAYDYAVYGGLDGHVINISPDAIVDDRTGESHYNVRIRTDRNGLRDQTGRALPIGPGMIADVSLIGDKRSVLSYLLTPITRLSENAFRER